MVQLTLELATFSDREDKDDIRVLLVGIVDADLIWWGRWPDTFGFSQRHIFMVVALDEEKASSAEQVLQFGSLICGQIPLLNSMH